MANAPFYHETDRTSVLRPSVRMVGLVNTVSLNILQCKSKRQSYSFLTPVLHVYDFTKNAF